MKKILTIATLIVSALAILPAQAGNNKKNKNKDKKAAACTEACCAPVKLTSTSDSVSYAAGYAATRGLMPYLQQRLHVDTAYINEFVRGFREAVSKAKDPAYVAYQAGTTIAQQATESILPGMDASSRIPKTLCKANSSTMASSLPSRATPLYIRRLQPLNISNRKPKLSATPKRCMESR